jgi:ribosomal protein S21
MSLTGIEWNKKSIFDSILRDLKRKPEEERTEKDHHVIEYFEAQLSCLEEKIKKY